MGLAPGERLGSYVVAELIGRGGMGEVYRARDTVLNRDVALKVLPDADGNDPQRLARFRREAQILASLNHPHIANIHGLEESGDRRALVLELVEGPTLADAIARDGALPVDQALPIATQIAEALDAAHEHGVIHRDLKPANIKLRPDGTVKVLDFGLAKAYDLTSLADDASSSPTITSPAMTQLGMIMGTAAYMSPEQARGRPVDKRTDIWAFGCVLYEMLTGARAFEGDDVTETVGFVVAKEPRWDRLPPDTPQSIRRLLQRCLQKDRKNRLRDIGDVRLEIAEAMKGPSADALLPGTVMPAWPRRRILIGAAGLVLAGIVGGSAVWLATRSAPSGEGSPVTRLLVETAPADRLRAFPGDDASDGYVSRTAFALSNDGRTLVFSGAKGSEQQIYMRSLDRLEAVPIAGTDGGSNPFFSPDSQWVGFWAAGALKRVRLTGGPPVTICATEPIFGASWTTDQRIVFAQQLGGLLQVPVAGGTPERLTMPNSARKELSHRLPQVLPGNGAVIFTVTRRSYPSWDGDDAEVVVQSLSTGTRTVLVEGGADARYIRTGHLLYVRRGALLAAPFDPVGLTLTGGAVGVVSNVMQAVNMWGNIIESGAGQFNVSESGTLAYVTGGPRPDPERSLVWVDRTGRAEPFPGPRRFLLGPRISPDGRRVSFSTLGYERAIWIQDLSRGGVAKLATGATSGWALWTRDASRLIFLSEVSDGGGVNLFWRPVDGSSQSERLTSNPRDQWPMALSPDGRTLAFVQAGLGLFDIWELPLTGDRQPRQILATQGSEFHPEFSPDGRWLAYSSDVSGRREVYIQTYPDAAIRRQISTDGGSSPSWRQDGRELYYQAPHPSETGRIRMMAVPVSAESQREAGTPTVLFEGPYTSNGPGRYYDVTPDGRRFLMIQPHDRPPIATRHIVLVHNWFEELTRLVPTD
jgi:serine/threonine-protein kinase